LVPAKVLGDISQTSLASIIWASLHPYFAKPEGSPLEEVNTT